MFAVNVAINLPVKNLFRQFTYSVPEALQFIDSGWRVVVPFSGQKVEGFVVERVPLPSDEVLRSKLKPVEAALGDTPWFDKEMLATAKWMAAFAGKNSAGLSHQCHRQEGAGRRSTCQTRQGAACCPRSAGAGCRGT